MQGISVIFFHGFWPSYQLCSNLFAICLYFIRSLKITENISPQVTFGDIFSTGLSLLKSVVYSNLLHKACILICLLKFHLEKCLHVKMLTACPKISVASDCHIE